MTRAKYINIRKYDWVTLKGELVIKDGKALRDLEKREKLISYGGIL